MAYKQYVTACQSSGGVDRRRAAKTRVVTMLAILLSTFASLSGCATIHDWDAIHGKVLSAENNEPIEGVVLVYHWIGTAGSYVASSDQCYHLETAVTDADGIFVIPAWKESFGNRQHRNLDSKRTFMKVAYKPGYRLSNLTYEKEAWEQDVVYLEKQKPRGREERLQYLVDLIGQSGCGPASSEQRQKLLGFYRTVYQEAVGLSITPDEKGILDLQDSIASRWNDSDADLPPDESRAIFENKVKALLQ